jgi:hypothetical protein
VVGPWEDGKKIWAHPTRNCGTCHMFQFRKVLKQPANCGKRCPVLHKRAPCYKIHYVRDGRGSEEKEDFTARLAYEKHIQCKEDCIVSKWSVFSNCTKPCGGGLKHRHRKVVTKSNMGGKGCPSLAESASCSRAPCKCKPGSFHSPVYCKHCPVGKFTEKVGAHACLDCGQGRYAVAEGARACTGCPTGRYSSSTGRAVDCLWYDHI